MNPAPQTPKTMRSLPLNCGLSVSIQASSLYLSFPKNDVGPYAAWQLEFERPPGSTVEPPDEALRLLRKHHEPPASSGVYSFVPTGIVLKVLKACGGAALTASPSHPFIVQHKGLGCSKTCYWIHPEQRQALRAPDRASANMVQIPK